VGESTPYCLVAVPPAYTKAPGGIQRFREDVFWKTGVLLSYTASVSFWDAEQSNNTQINLPYLRAYLGGNQRILIEAISRWRKAGIRYGMGII
jgi:hypothetical protein